MSLEKGGLFDINNNWLTPHNEHRVGSSADIGISGINQAAVCVALNLVRLRLIVRHYTGANPVENEGTGPHFHINMR
jgi:hypothetical protein